MRNIKQIFWGLTTFHRSKRFTILLDYFFIQGILIRISCAGKAGEFIDRGDNTYGGKYVVNPSGGLISKGHPLGATGKTLFYFIQTSSL